MMCYAGKFWLCIARVVCCKQIHAEFSAQVFIIFNLSVVGRRTIIGITNVLYDTVSLTRDQFFRLLVITIKVSKRSNFILKTTTIILVDIICTVDQSFTKIK